MFSSLSAGSGILLIGLVLAGVVGVALWFARSRRRPRVEAPPVAPPAAPPVDLTAAEARVGQPAAAETGIAAPDAVAPPVTPPAPEPVAGQAADLVDAVRATPAEPEPEPVAEPVAEAVAEPAAEAVAEPAPEADTFDLAASTDTVAAIEPATPPDAAPTGEATPPRAPIEALADGTDAAPATPAPLDLELPTPAVDIDVAALDVAPPLAEPWPAAAFVDATAAGVGVDLDVGEPLAASAPVDEEWAPAPPASETAAPRADAAGVDVDLGIAIDLDLSAAAPPPLAPVDAAPAAAPVAEGPAAPAQPPAIPPLLLMVDDSAVVRARMRKLLDGAGHRVELARDGREALAMLTSGRYALMITDLEMPTMNGFELIAAANALHGAEDMPIVAISGHDDAHLRLQGLRGVRGLFKKPWNDAELLAHLDALLAEPRPARPQADAAAAAETVPAVPATSP